MARISVPVTATRSALPSPIHTGPIRSGVNLSTPPSNSTSARKVGWEYLAQSIRTSLPLVVIDLLALVVAIAVSRQFLITVLGGAAGMNISVIFPPIAMGFVLIGAELGLYPGIQLSPVEEFRRLIVAATSMFAVWTVAILIVSEVFTVQKGFLALSFLMCATTLVMGRSVARRVLGRCQWWGFPTLVCGDDTRAIEVFEWLRGSPHVGLRPVGVIADPSTLELDGSESWFIGDWSSVRSAAVENKAYWALVIPSEEAHSDITDEVSNCLEILPHVQLISELTGLPDHWGGRRPVDGLDGIHIQQNLMLPGKRAMKRLMDLTVSVSALLALFPVLLAIALAVKLTSRGPIFFGHTRLGLDGRGFKAWKFRTMVVDADKTLEKHLQAHPELRAEWEKDHKLKWDPRITTVGRVFRKLSLDELPQLWNVLCGEMSLVGPRPIVTKEVEKYGDCWGLYTSVKPGITGLWQVSGRNNTTYDERVQLDEYYVRNWSPWLDLYLMIRTVRTVLFAEGAY
ncbi:UDP-glucose:undecaprenyl-phosphate glucose-1-phosphate transferase [Posidoniimonas polymericola]|uniref:UDP-glucose:undecaprenyl-phosphate glucose-1-phosphate transferase n=1 Tax=Posidoniimonas polymericola TaxID=2528002 RepID=A0A5C5YFM5_9BACT|nr:undecaprenyl-phosphate galactose phosphotransferase WbaP [Posidoniimonas polymericola]TWT73749.1 UDP-glucose:undecaprenyl-phosphate glucose-1-phosphate transferase [Posidoniimonas polymericola]